MFKHGNLCSLGIVQPLLGFASHLVVENPAWEAAMPRLWWFTNAPDIKHSQSCCDEPSTLHHILYQHMCSSLTLFSTLGIGIINIHHVLSNSFIISMSAGSRN